MKRDTKEFIIEILIFLWIFGGIAWQIYDTFADHPKGDPNSDYTAYQ